MTNIQYVLALLLGILIVFTIAIWSLGFAKPQANLRELKSRTKVWWLIFAVIAIVLNVSTMAGVLLFAFVSFLALKEFLTLIPTRTADHRVLFWAYLTIPIQYYWVSTQWYGMFIIFIPVYMFLLIPLRALLAGETKGFLASVSILQWGLMMSVFSLSHVAYLIALDPVANPKVHGPSLALFLVAMTELNDIAQFFVGKSIGKHKIIPKISPNKTVEGFVGGVVVSVLMSWVLAPYLTPLSAGESIFVGLLIAGVGFVGDVTISAIKRDIGVKDSGALLPGHGGILDRVDSMTYTSLIFFHFMRYFYFG